MKDILEKDNFLKPPKVGEIIEGKIIKKEKKALFLDLGTFGTGIIYGKEFQDAKNLLKGLKIGDNVFAKVTSLKNEDGYIELSISQADKQLTWGELKKKKEQEETISVKILGANKGGLLAEVSGISGFLPVSQLSPENYPKVEGADTSKILKELQKFVGNEMEVQVFDLDRKTGKLILSERVKKAQKIREILKKYKAGDIVEGEVTGLVDFGIFIKFPLASEEKTQKKDDLEEPIEGLIHISEVDWQLVEDLSEVVKVGQKVKAKIIEISGDRVSLSLKALKENPWKEVEKKYKKGDKVSGKVVKFNPFGAFVQVDPEIQGLCHISEFGLQKKMEEKLEIGKSYDFEILEVRPEEHRMSLRPIEQ